jgi:hypothetical protein
MSEPDWHAIADQYARDILGWQARCAALRAELAALEPLRLAAAGLRDAQTWIERAATGEAEEDAACGAFDAAAEAICDAMDALRAAQ